MWMVTIGADCKVATVEQDLTAENFARVRPGMDRAAVRTLLGRPTRMQTFALKPEEVWAYRWWERRTKRGLFNVHFDPSGSSPRPCAVTILRRATAAEARTPGAAPRRCRQSVRTNVTFRITL